MSGITKNVFPAQAIRSAELNEGDETCPPAMETCRELSHTYLWIDRDIKYANGRHKDSWTMSRHYI